jgi:hypothetical protein
MTGFWFILAALAAFALSIWQTFAFWRALQVFLTAKTRNGLSLYGIIYGGLFALILLTLGVGLVIVGIAKW